MAEKDSGWTWFKYGCLGCVGLIVVLILVAAGIGMAAKKKADSIQNESRVLTPDVPRGAAAPEVRPGSVTLSPPAAAAAAAGRVVLDLSGADIRVQPAAPGESLRVEADFDPISHELTEKLETGEDGAWVYSVSFRGQGSGFLGGLAKLFGGKGPELTVFLPADTPIELEADLREGGMELELGGLWLVAADLRFERGGVVIEVDEPMREPMEHLSFHGSMGGFATASLGNASPAVLEVDFSMGGMNLDLTGAWRRDAVITVRSSMGGGAIHLPDDVIIEGLKDAPPAPPGSPEVPRPVLRFTDSSRLDDIEIRAPRR